MSIKLYDIIAKHKKVVSITAFFLVLAVHNGYAKNESAEKEPLSIELNAKKVLKDKDGKETFLVAEKVKPGDIVQYSAVYSNRSKKSLTGINASLPVPFGMTYVEKSAQPTTALATADGVKFEAEPLMRTVKDKDGKEQQVAVPYSEYKSMRWTISELDAGKSQEVSARMRVNELPTLEKLMTKPAAAAPATAEPATTAPETVAPATKP